MQSSSPSKFLALPGEILNIIYEYALTNPTGLYPDTSYDPLRPRLYTSPYLRREFNNLKFTCRKLYRDTAGLELRFNTLQFVADDNIFECETELCLRFLSTISPSAQALIPAIALYGPRTSEADTHYRSLKALSRLYPLSSWCATHPSTTVTLTDPGFNFFNCHMCEETAFLEVGTLFSLLFKGKDISSFGTSLFQAHVDELAHWASHWPGFEHLKVSQNLKLMPSGPLDEQILRKSLAWRTVPASVEDVETCLSLAREWDRNGI